MLTTLPPVRGAGKRPASEISSPTRTKFPPNRVAEYEQERETIVKGVMDVTTGVVTRQLDARLYRHELEARHQLQARLYRHELEARELEARLLV